MPTLKIMKKFNDIQSALEVFKEAAKCQAEATEKGNYKLANKYYNKIVSATLLLKNTNSLTLLTDLMTDYSIGVRLWSACYLLPINEKESISVLEKIAKEPNIHALTADTTINEWEKGNLKF